MPLTGPLPDWQHVHSLGCTTGDGGPATLADTPCWQLRLMPRRITGSCKEQVRAMGHQSLCPSYTNCPGCLVWLGIITPKLPASSSTTQHSLLPGHQCSTAPCSKFELLLVGWYGLQPPTVTGLRLCSREHCQQVVCIGCLGGCKQTSRCSPAPDGTSSPTHPPLGTLAYVLHIHCLQQALP